MRNPSQALLWSAFSLSWPALLTQIAAAVVIIFLIDLALDPGVDSHGIIEAADGVLMVSLAFLYIATLNGIQNSGRVTSSLGFPYRAEFSLPVSTAMLTFVPLLYFSVLTQLAIFVPGTIVNFLFLDVEVSYFSISFIIFQLTIVPLMLTWWTRNGLASLAGWILGIYLYASGYLLPEFTRVEGTWVFEVDAGSAYLMPVCLSALMLALSYFGVKRQRSSESLFGLGPDDATGANTPVLREVLPLPVSECPTSSPIRAQLWKERQLNGEYRAIFAGLAGAGITLAILGIIRFFVGVPVENVVLLSNTVLLSAALFLSVCVGLTATMFGVRYRNGIAYVSAHDRTTPLTTLQLTIVRVSVGLSSALIAGFVMIVALWLLGSLVIVGFAEMRIQFIDFFDFLVQTTFLGGLLQATLILLSFLSGLVMFSLFLTWFMLHSRKMTICIIIFCVYVFLLASGIRVAFGEDGALVDAIDMAAAAHVWFLILFLPVSIAMMARDLLRDWVITNGQLLRLLAVGAVFQLLNLIWLLGPDNYGALKSSLTTTQVAYLAMQGFAPLLAMVFALWTANRLRHG